MPSTQRLHKRKNHTNTLLLSQNGLSQNGKNFDFLKNRKLWRERGKKNAKFSAPHPSGPQASGHQASAPPPFGAPGFGTPLFPGLGLHPSGPHPLPKSELAEIEIGRSRNWPNSKKKKLAEVEIGRSRPRSCKTRISSTPADHNRGLIIQFVTKTSTSLVRMLKRRSCRTQKGEKTSTLTKSETLQKHGSIHKGPNIIRFEWMGQRIAVKGLETLDSVRGLKYPSR